MDMAGHGGSASAHCRDKLIIERNNFACLRSLTQYSPHELAEPISPSARARTCGMIVISFLSPFSESSQRPLRRNPKGKRRYRGIANCDRDDRCHFRGFAGSIECRISARNDQFVPCIPRVYSEARISFPASFFIAYFIRIEMRLEFVSEGNRRGDT